jgi:hypothetical protein
MLNEVREKLQGSNKRLMHFRGVLQFCSEIFKGRFGLTVARLSGRQNLS